MTEIVMYRFFNRNHTKYTRMCNILERAVAGLMMNGYERKGDQS